MVDGTVRDWLLPPLTRLVLTIVHIDGYTQLVNWVRTGVGGKWDNFKVKKVEGTSKGPDDNGYNQKKKKKKNSD